MFNIQPSTPKLFLSHSTFPDKRTNASGNLSTFCHLEGKAKDPSRIDQAFELKSYYYSGPKWNAQIEYLVPSHITLTPAPNTLQVKQQGMIMMNGLSAATNSSDVKYPPNVANSRGLSAAEMEVDKLYEPKQNKKIVRIFTVILYMFSVSLGAILLSLYYVFLWKNPHTQAINRKVSYMLDLVEKNILLINYYYQ